MICLRCSPLSWGTTSALGSKAQDPPLIVGWAQIVEVVWAETARGVLGVWVTAFGGEGCFVETWHKWVWEDLQTTAAAKLPTKCPTCRFCCPHQDWWSAYAGISRSGGQALCPATGSVSDDTSFSDVVLCVAVECSLQFARSVAVFCICGRNVPWGL